MIATARALAPVSTSRWSTWPTPDLGRTLRPGGDGRQRSPVHSGGHPGRPGGRLCPPPRTRRSAAGRFPARTGATPSRSTTPTAGRPAWCPIERWATWDGDPFDPAATTPCRSTASRPDPTRSRPRRCPSAAAADSLGPPSAIMDRRDDQNGPPCAIPCSSTTRSSPTSSSTTAGGGCLSTRSRSTTAAPSTSRWPTVLDGLMTDGGTDPAAVMELFDKTLATAAVSVRQPQVPRLHPRRSDQGLAAVRHGRGVFVAPGDVVDRGGRARWPPRTRLCGSWPTWPACPKGAGGCFVSGGSAGNLSGLMVGRDTATYRMGDAAPDQPVVAISEEAHSSVGKALHVLGVEPLLVPVRRPPADRPGPAERHSRPIRGATTSSPWWPPAGTTNAGIIDDLDGVADVAEERKLWYHVDGAYGCCRTVRPVGP